MFDKELEEKLKNENLERCKNCLKFLTCSVLNKEEIVECDDFEEVQEQTFF
ncbi:MAG: hypothetical protein NWE93_06665 [Candidatus Bathyarchaeota archaeon]|nr:hypothetical protein [Candidatus Bathyarchaeota archaeon]